MGGGGGSGGCRQKKCRASFLFLRFLSGFLTLCSFFSAEREHIIGFGAAVLIFSGCQH